MTFKTTVHSILVKQLLNMKSVADRRENIL